MIFGFLVHELISLVKFFFGGVHESINSWEMSYQPVKVSRFSWYPSRGNRSSAVALGATPMTPTARRLTPSDALERAPACVARREANRHPQTGARGAVGFPIGILVVKIDGPGRL